MYSYDLEFMYNNNVLHMYTVGIFMYIDCRPVYNRYNIIKVLQ